MNDDWTGNIDRVACSGAINANFIPFRDTTIDSPSQDHPKSRISAQTIKIYETYRIFCLVLLDGFAFLRKLATGE